MVAEEHEGPVRRALFGKDADSNRLLKVVIAVMMALAVSLPVVLITLSANGIIKGERQQGWSTARAKGSRPTIASGNISDCEVVVSRQ